MSLFEFKRYSKLGKDLQYPCAKYATHKPEEIRLFNVKLKVVDVLLVFLFIRANSRNSKRDDNNHGFQKKLEDFDDG